MSHPFEKVTFIQKWHILPKITHSSKNDTYPKMSHSSKNGTLIQKWQIHSKKSHSSKNGTFIQKWHTHPKMAHSSKNYNTNQIKIMNQVCHSVFIAEEIFKTSQCEEKKGTGPEEKLLPWLMLLQLLVGIALKGENL